MKFYNLLKSASAKADVLVNFSNDNEDYCLQLFSAIQSYKERDDILDLFYKALSQNAKCAIKILIYTRDIKCGLGKRNLFRKIFSFLVNECPYIARQLMRKIPSFGRYDDLFVLIQTSLEQELIDYIKRVLYQDLENLEKGESISLLAKWMPSINTSNKEVVKMGKYMASKLNSTEEEYRKLLSELRKGIVIENSLREKNYKIDYTKVPSVAKNKYKETFLRNDANGYLSYLANKKINENVPMYMINSEAYGLFQLNELSESKINEIELKWQKYFDIKEELNTLVVRDGSISMYCNKKIPILLVDALSLYYSSKLKGGWKNRVINFSENPEFIELNRNNVYQNIQKLATYNSSSNLNLEKVFLLILEEYKKNLGQKEIINRILIVTDLEFDIGVDSIKKIKMIKRQFTKLGINLPQVVYWNVNAKNIGIENDNEILDIKFINGFSKDLIELVLENKRLDNISLLNKCISKYDFVDEMNI